MRKLYYHYLFKLLPIKKIRQAENVNDARPESIVVATIYALIPRYIFLVFAHSNKTLLIVVILISTCAKSRENGKHKKGKVGKMQRITSICYSASFLHVVCIWTGSRAKVVKTTRLVLRFFCFYFLQKSFAVQRSS